MIDEAISKYALNRSECFMVGDKKTDLETAKNAKIKGFLFDGENLLNKIMNISKQLNL